MLTPSIHVAFRICRPVYAQTEIHSSGPHVLCLHIDLPRPEEFVSALLVKRQ